jgi:hypothetical protein
VSRTGLEPTNSLQPGLQARRQAPELTISFTSPNTHPETATPEDPSQATVATAHTVTGTPSKRYKPIKRPRLSTLPLMICPARAPGGDPMRWSAVTQYAGEISNTSPKII